MCEGGAGRFTESEWLHGYLVRPRKALPFLSQTTSRLTRPRQGLIGSVAHDERLAVVSRSP